MTLRKLHLQYNNSGVYLALDGKLNSIYKRKKVDFNI